MKVGIISNVESCIPLLQFLRSNSIETILYIGSYSKDTNISSLISVCKSSNISVEIEKQPAQLYDWIQSQQLNYCFVYGYKKLIDMNRVGGFSKKIFNIHPGKLPQYRGASPLFWQLRNGEKSIGLHIHFMNEKYDAGNIVWSKEIPVEPHFSFGLAEYIVSNALIEGVHFVLHSDSEELWEEGVVQNEKDAHTYQKPTLKDVLIDWQTMNAIAVVNLVRACNPWNKGAITLCNGMEIKILDAEKLNVAADNTIPGTIQETTDGILISCASNSLVKVHQMSINGIFVPARFADKFGIITGNCFSTPT